MPRERWSLVVGSVGMGLMIIGLVVLVGQAVAAMNTGQWPVTTLGTVLKDPLMIGVVPAGFQAWLEDPRSWHTVHRIVDAIFNAVPLALLLGAGGLLMTWRSLRLDRSRVGQ